MIEIELYDGITEEEYRNDLLFLTEIIKQNNRCEDDGIYSVYRVDFDGKFEEYQKRLRRLQSTIRLFNDGGWSMFSAVSAIYTNRNNSCFCITINRVDKLFDDEKELRLCDLFKYFKIECPISEE